MLWPKPVTLSLNNVRLEPLSLDHLDGLKIAVQDGKLYDHWYTSIPEPKNMNLEIDRRLDLQQKNNMVPFAAISLWDKIAVGMTTYMNVDKES